MHGQILTPPHCPYLLSLEKPTFLTKGILSVSQDTTPCSMSSKKTRSARASSSPRLGAYLGLSRAHQDPSPHVHHPPQPMLTHPLPQ